MLYCIYSNELPVLKQVVVSTLQNEPLSDPFQAEQILVPGTGLSQWLKLGLADALGVSANIDYPMPSNFLWRLFHAVLEDVPKESDFNKDVLLWHLLEILPTQLENDAFLPLRHYLADGDELRSYQLATKIADVFDQYLLYRIDWINDWSQGGNIAAEKQPWQPILWRALCERITGLKRKALHRAGLFEQFVWHLKNEKEKSRQKLADLPPRLFLFGFNNLPPIYLDALQVLAEYRDVYLLVANPCRIYWGDLKTTAEEARWAQGKRSDNIIEIDAEALNRQSHALLSSLGKQGRELLGQLQGLQIHESDYYIDPGRRHLLSSIQQDILDGLDRSADLLFDSNSENKAAVGENDFSISFHNNYSPLREVEVLHDQLLHLFEQHSDLTPKDIVVMVPDIDRYSPLIHAVFDSARQIPFSVADRSVGNEEPLLLRVKSLLQLPASRLSVSEVLELLELPAIRLRFQINAQDMETLSQWVEESGIRWGMDGEHRSALDLPAFEQNSWRFGLRRMLAGFSMGGQSVYQGIASYNEVSGLSAALAGKLATLLDGLDFARKQLAVSHTVDEWITLTHQIVDDFFVFEAGEELALQALWNGLERLKKHSEQAAYSQSLSHRLFMQSISASLSESNSGSHFLNGQVSFCTLLPKRAIPFKVVCLLGMNEGDYPVAMPSLGFDLMAHQFRAGDRSRRDEERFLFLEALLAAEIKLYLSWVGRSIQDNSEKQPSVLLSELLEYCLNNYRLAGDGLLSLDDSADNLREYLITRHALQAFSADNFIESSENPLCFSYAKAWLPKTALLDSALTTPETADKPSTHFSDLSVTMTQAKVETETSTAQQVIPLATLQNFFIQPCRYFMRHYLQVDLNLPTNSLVEHEPFVVDGLSHYQLKQEFLTYQLSSAQYAEGDKQHYANYQRATGLLPTGFAGEKSLQQAESDVRILLEALSDYDRQNKSAIEICLKEVSGVVLEGWLQSHYQGWHIDYRVSALKGKDYISSWIAHLALCASEHPEFNGTRLLGIGKNNKKVVLEEVCFKPLSREQALVHLGELIQIFQRGQHSPLPFFPETAWQWYRTKFLETKKSSPEENDSSAWNKAQNRFYGTSHSPLQPEGGDPAVARIYPCLEDVAEPFLRLAETIFTPLGQAMAEEKSGVNND